MSFVRKAVVAAIGSLALASVSQAASLGLTSGSPDVFTNSMAINYQAGSFTAISDSNQIISVITPTATYDTNGEGKFDLEAQIDASGHLTGGTITITGSLYSDTVSVPDVTYNPSSVLLIGTLTDFGYSLSTGGAEFQFKFNTTGGLFTTIGFPGLGGVILTSTDARFGSSFLSFANTISDAPGKGDTIGLAVPTPASWAGGMALAGMLVVARGRSRWVASV